MTPKRKKWWDSLPANEKELRESLKTHRRLLSLDKMALTDNKDNAYIAKMIRRQKMLIKAIKHELERTTTMIYTGNYEDDEEKGELIKAAEKIKVYCASRKGCTECPFCDKRRCSINDTPCDWRDFEDEA